MIIFPELKNKRVLISAGPMRTDIDPVRFIQNRSSGKTGLALAQSCKELGASRVSVILGPVSPEIRKAFKEFDVRDYQGPSDYGKHLEALFPECDIFFSVAAVLDFEVTPRAKKIERSTLEALSILEMDITPVPDFVAKVGARKLLTQKVIAFAAESGTESEILERAKAKMLKKSADALIANPLWPRLGPESDQNLVWILRPGVDPVKLGPDSKERLSTLILETLFEG